MTKCDSAKARDCSTLKPSELLNQCIEKGDSSAWEEFVRRYRRTIGLVALRVAKVWNAASSSVVDDLVQETFLRLCDDNCRVLRQFRSEQADGLSGFLKVVTANLAQDHFKAIHAAKRGSGLVSELASTLELVDESKLQGPERALLFREVETFLAQKYARRQRDRTVFWLYYREGMTAGAIASIPALGLTTKGVESIIYRLTRQLRSHFDLAPPQIPPHIAKGIRH